MRGLTILLVLTGLWACSSEPPDHRLADAYVDLLRFRDRSAEVDTVAIRTGVDSVLAAHGFTEEIYRASFAALADDPDRLPAFFARVDERVRATNPALQPAR